MKLSLSKNQWVMVGTLVFIFVSGVGYSWYRSRGDATAVGTGMGTVNVIYLDDDEEDVESFDDDVLPLPAPPDRTGTLADENNSEADADTMIIIYISGAVVSPDVYELPASARVIDAVTLAGGLLEEADINRVNLASFMTDAQHIVIPTIGEDIEYDAAVSTPIDSSATQTGTLINVNTASLTELTTLPGVGPVLAQNIISYREEHGNFTSVEQLENVSRIGPTILNNLRPLVTVTVTIE